MKSTLILLTIAFLFACPVLGALRGGDSISKYVQDEATTYDPTHDTEEKDLTETSGSDKEMTPGKYSNKPAVDKTGKPECQAQPAKVDDWVQHLFVVVGGLIAAYLIAMYVWRTIKCVAWILFIILGIVFILYARKHTVGKAFNKVIEDGPQYVGIAKNALVTVKDAASNAYEIYDDVMTGKDGNQSKKVEITKKVLTMLH
eukprot:1163984_1